MVVCIKFWWFYYWLIVLKKVLKKYKKKIEVDKIVKGSIMLYIDNYFLMFYI